MFSTKIILAVQNFIIKNSGVASKDEANASLPQLVAKLENMAKTMLCF